MTEQTGEVCVGCGLSAEAEWHDGYERGYEAGACACAHPFRTGFFCGALATALVWLIVMVYLRAGG
jgi:hypothetical protein